MLHILWMILRILLIIIGILLGLLVVLLLLLLFCPVRYRLHASKEEEAALTDVRADARVSWLFGGAAVGVSYLEKNIGLSVRLFGIPLDKLLFGSKEEKPQEAPETEENGMPEEPAAEPESEAVTIPVSGPAALPGIEPEEKQEEEPSPAEILPEEKEPEALPDVIPAEEKPEALPEVLPEEEKPEALPETLPAEEEKATLPAEESDVVPAEEPEAAKGSPIRKIRSVFLTLRNKLQDIREKVRTVTTQVSWWKRFVFHEKTLAAIRLVLREAKGLVRHVLPTRMYGDLAFGFEDPSLTGRLTGLLAMTIPFHKNKVAVRPSFECRSFVGGDVTVKGRIYGAAFAAAAIRILINRNIHFVIRKIRNRNKQEKIHKEE